MCNGNGNDTFQGEYDPTRPIVTIRVWDEDEGDMEVSGHPGHWELPDSHKHLRSMAWAAEREALYANPRSHIGQVCHIDRGSCWVTAYAWPAEIDAEEED